MYDYYTCTCTCIKCTHVLHSHGLILANRFLALFAGCSAASCGMMVGLVND